MENRGSANDADNVVKDSSGDGIQGDDVVEESSFNLPIASTASAFSGSSLYASLQLPSVSNVNAHDARDGPRGTFSVTKKLEHASPCGPICYPDAGMGDFATNHDVAPGAFPVRTSQIIGASQEFRYPLSLYDSIREFTNEQSELEERVPNSAGAYSGTHGNSGIAAASGLYTVEGQQMPDGNEDGSVMIAEVQYITLKWYQRPLYRCIFVGLALFACCLTGAVVAMVVLVVRSPAAASSSLSPTTIPTPTGAPTVQVTPTPDPTAATNPPVAAPTTPPVAAPSTPPVVVPIFVTSPPVPTQAPTARTPPTSIPTTVTPVAIACKFLAIPNVTKCRSTFEFGGTTSGSTIPSEIGLLTQLTRLSFASNLLNSTIPREIGLLTRLMILDFSSNIFMSAIPSEIGLLTQLIDLRFYSSSLTSTIPSQIGLLTKLMWLDLSENQLTSTIPSEIGRLTQLSGLDMYSNELKGTIPSYLCSLYSLNGKINIDIGEITCASGCCV